MAQQTTHYDLTKPAYGERVDVAVLNSNNDKIDARLYEGATRVSDEYNSALSYVIGDFCIHENLLYKCISPTTGDWDATKWQLTTISAAFEPKHTWRLLETLTADGTERLIYSSNLPENVTGIMITNTTEAGASALTLGLGATFDGTTWETVGAISNGINTGVRYSRFWYFKDGNLWYSRSTSPLSQTNATGTVSERFEGTKIGGDVKRVRVYAPTGSLMPSGSTFEIYIRQ